MQWLRDHSPAAIAPRYLSQNCSPRFSTLTLTITNTFLRPRSRHLSEHVHVSSPTHEHGTSPHHEHVFPPPRPCPKPGESNKRNFSFLLFSQVGIAIKSIPLTTTPTLVSISIIITPHCFSSRARGRSFGSRPCFLGGPQ